MSQSKPPTDTQQIVPQYLIAGTIWNWEISNPLYTPTTATLVYYFNQLNPPNGTPYIFNLTTTADGNLFWTYADSATSAVPNLAAGNYRWASIVAGVSNGTSFRNAYQQGELTIFPDPTTGVDCRTAEEIILNALDAMIGDTASLDQSGYTIGNRTINKMDRIELLKYRDRYKSLVVAQQKLLSFQSGNLKSTSGIRIRFDPTYGYGNAQGGQWRGNW